MITFISGGARSGKSRFAEKLATSIFERRKCANPDARLIYVATAIRSDREMEARINQHQARRIYDWQTIEEPCDITKILLNSKAADVILVDCLTVWLSNVLYVQQEKLENPLVSMTEWLHVAKDKQQTVLFVSNDVNEEVPHKDKLVQQYIYQLERVHHLIVDRCDEAIQVVAGIPTYWKGGEA